MFSSLTSLLFAVAEPAVIRREYGTRLGRLTTPSASPVIVVLTSLSGVLFGDPNSPEDNKDLTVLVVLDHHIEDNLLALWPVPLSPITPSQEDNVLLYWRAGLENINHSMSIHGIIPKSAIIGSAFDYALYTFEETDDTSATASSPTSSSPSSNTSPVIGPAKKKKLAGPVAGGVVGGLLLHSILAFLAYFSRRRQSNTRAFTGGGDDQTEKPDTAPQPLSRNSAPTTELTYEPWAPELDSSAITTLPSGETRLCLSNQLISPALLAW
ncbi:hypothetical protein B0H19DRAFT_1350478 [Mycena capillaripes]|nr:hypothetical protein B0H19DRAFT_1350478 [Mycena capillaripes]